LDVILATWEGAKKITVFRIPENARQREFARQLRSENKLWRAESLFQSGTFLPDITSAGRLPPGIPANAGKQRSMHSELFWPAA